MKTKVNSQWYAQLIVSHKKAIKEEIRMVKMQNDRYFNYPTYFDMVKTKCTKEQVFVYLQDAVKKLGTASEDLKKSQRLYEPCDSKKPDWKRIEQYIKNNANKIDNAIGINSKWDYYLIVANFFCLAKWGVPENEKNNNRVFDLMYKYCEGY